MKRLTVLYWVLDRWATDIESGTLAEQETAQVLHALLYAINHGRTAELYSEIEPVLDRWLDESAICEVRANVGKSTRIEFAIDERSQMSQEGYRQWQRDNPELMAALQRLQRLQDAKRDSEREQGKGVGG